MMNACIDCGRHFPGLDWFVPDEVWTAIAGRLDAGELCPWCADVRMKKVGVTARPLVSLALGNFDAFNYGVLAELELLDHRRTRQQLGG